MKMTNVEFAEKLRDIAENYPTLYVMGCFGAPMTGGNVDRYCNYTSYNQRPERSQMIRAAADKTPPVYGFDCVCLIKGVLWGWSGDPSKIYGGAVYQSNGVPDITTDAMLRACDGVSEDFTSVLAGELLWMPGHTGICIGGGLAVECTPAWDNKVQITAIGNIGEKAGCHTRRWVKHGRLPYVTYTEKKEEKVNGMVLPTLCRGMVVPQVNTLQAILISRFGISCGAAGVDGSFGGDTLRAVLTFQKQSGLVQDGIVGGKSWEKLLN